MPAGECENTSLAARAWTPRCRVQRTNPEVRIDRSNQSNGQAAQPDEQNQFEGRPGCDVLAARMIRVDTGVAGRLFSILSGRAHIRVAYTRSPVRATSLYSSSSPAQDSCNSESHVGGSPFSSSLPYFIRARRDILLFDSVTEQCWPCWERILLCRAAGHRTRASDVRLARHDFPSPTPTWRPSPRGRLHRRLNARRPSRPSRLATRCRRLGLGLGLPLPLGLPPRLPVGRSRRRCRDFCRQRTLPIPLPRLPRRTTDWWSRKST